MNMSLTAKAPFYGGPSLAANSRGGEVLRMPDLTLGQSAYLFPSSLFTCPDILLPSL